MAKDKIINPQNLPYKINTPSNVTVQPATLTTLATLVIETGTWLITACHEWYTSFADAYNDRITNADNSLCVVQRGMTGSSGGGATMSVVYQNAGTRELYYKVYLSGSESRVASSIRFSAVKVGGGNS